MGSGGRGGTQAIDRGRRTVAGDERRARQGGGHGAWNCEVTEAVQRGLRWLQWIEDGILAVLVLTLVALAGTQILLRDLFHTGISWADPVMRDLVLWTGMLG